MTLKKLITSNLFFGIFIAIFIIAVGIATAVRGGKDLKVYLYGAAQTLHEKSPYDNPVDQSRPLFRYAPSFALMMRPFLIETWRNPDDFFWSERIPKYKNITITCFYIAKIMLLFLASIFLLKLASSASAKTWANFKLAFFLSMPFIGYELANNQNKLIALPFLIFSLFLFERNNLWASGLFFNLALIVYIPLAPFFIYFFKKRKEFLIIFFITAVLLFIILPSIVWGSHYNNFLLKDWYTRCLKPFFSAKSYSAYLDLRRSSQSLPSAIGRIFVTGKKPNLHYLISPIIIHIIVRTLSFLVSALSVFAVWFSSEKTRSLQFSVLLILSLILPQYCIYYTWAYLLVIYFFVLDYTDSLKNDRFSKRTLHSLIALVFISNCLILITAIKYLSILFWSTLALWSGMVYLMLKSIRFKKI